MDFYLVTYDIPDDRRRTRIADLLEDYGARVQFSVFEVWLDETTHREMMTRLKELLVSESDSVRLYHLCAVCQERVTVLGQGKPPAPPDLLIV